MIRVILLDSSLSRLQVMKLLAEEVKTPQVQIQGIFTSVEDLFNGGDLEQCDLIISSALLRDTDGFGLLERMEKEGIQGRVKTILILSAGNIGMEEKYYRAGADYCMNQPCDAGILFERAATICAAEEPAKLLEERVKNYLAQKDLVTTDIGQRYLEKALVVLLENNLDCKLVRAVYNQVAKSENVKISAVDSGIRRVIAKWRKEQRAGMTDLPELAGCVANGKVLKILAQKILKEG